MGSLLLVYKVRAVIDIFILNLENILNYNLLGLSNRVIKYYKYFSS